jgi:hypothetical protein
MARIRMKNPAKAQPKALVLPEGPYLDATDVVTPSGYQLVELMGANGASQASIAARLGLTHLRFKKLLAKQDGENELRYAWERGRGALEFEFASLLIAEARKGNVLALIYGSKALLNWTDQPAPAQTNIGLQIQLPAAMDRESYLRSISQLPQVQVITDQTGGAHE